MDLLFIGVNLCAVAAAIVASYALTWLARLISPRIGLLDKPDGARKLHAKAVPLMGGVAIYGAFTITYVAIRAMNFAWLDDAESSLRSHTVILLSAGLVCLVGLWDDRRPMRPLHKLLWQIAACLPFVVWGPTVASIELLGVHVELGYGATAFTLFWLIACINALNLLDGLDGLATTVGLLIATTMAVLALHSGNLGAAVMSMVFAGSLFGFLLHNWPPARIFLGDAGSLMIGYLVGALSIEFSHKAAASFAIAAPVVIVSLPFFDTLMAIVRRVLNGRGIGEGDCAHIHHRLQRRGLTRRQALMVVATLSSVMAISAIVSVHYRVDLVSVATCASVLSLLIVSRVFGFEETLLLWHHMKEVTTAFMATTRSMRSRSLLARLRQFHPDQQNELWGEMCRRVAAFGGVSLELTCHRQQETDVISRLAWKLDTPEDAEVALWHFQYTVPRNHELQICSAVSGYSRPGSRQRREDLFRVIETFCDHWPIEGEFPKDAVEPAWALGAPVTVTAIGKEHLHRREKRRAA